MSLRPHRWSNITCYRKLNGVCENEKNKTRLSQAEETRYVKPESLGIEKENNYVNMSKRN